MASPLACHCHLCLESSILLPPDLQRPSTLAPPTVCQTQISQPPSCHVAASVHPTLALAQHCLPRLPPSSALVCPELLVVGGLGFLESGGSWESGRSGMEIWIRFLATCTWPQCPASGNPGLLISEPGQWNTRVKMSGGLSSWSKGEWVAVGDFQTPSHSA